MPEFPGRLRTPRLPSAPSSPAPGEMYYDTGTSTLYWWNGTAWTSASGGSAAPEVFIGASAPTRDQQVLWVDTDESPPAVTRDINMDSWHVVGAAGEPAFQNAWVNFSSTTGQEARFRKFPDGTVRLAGIVKGGANSTVAWTLPVGYRPRAAMVFLTPNSGGRAAITIGSDGTVLIAAQDGNVTTQTLLDGITFDTDSVLQTTSVVAQPIEPWHTVGAVGEPAFQNSWVNYGGGYQQVAFRKDPTGRVAIRGLATGGTAGAAVPGSGVAFTLPVGYRPINRVTAAGSLGGTPAQRLDVMPTGEVLMYSAGGGLPMGLDLIEFDTDTINNWTPATLAPNVILLDSWHNVGAAGEPAFGTGWTNLVSNNPGLGFRKGADGRVAFKGAVQIGAGAGGTIFTLPAGYRPKDYQRFASPTAKGPVYTDVNATGAVTYSAQPGFATMATNDWLDLSVIEFDTETVSNVSSSAAQQMEAWHTVGNPGEPTFTNSWVNYGDPFATAGFRKYLDGRVALRGSIKSGTLAQSAFTLPVGFRPPKALRYNSAVTAQAAAAWQQINIYPDGTVVCWGDSNVILSLDGIEFDTETVSNYVTGLVQLASPAKVTTLPVAPVDGQEIYFVADATNGVLWHLRYNTGSASAYKWEVVGGSALYANNESNVALPAGTTADGTAVPTPLAGDYDVEFGFTLTHTAGQASVGVGQTGVLYDCFVDTLTYVPMERVARLPGLTAGTTLKLYGVIPASQSGTAYRRHLRSMPVRVG